MIKSNINRGLTVVAGFMATAFVMNLAVINTACAETVKTTASKASSGSIVLQRWLNKNVSNHPSVLAAKAAVDSAGFKLIAADKALYNPDFEFDAETADTDTVYVGISQTIDWGDTRGARTKMAGSQRSVAKYAFESTRREIAVAFLNGLSDYHTSIALKKLAEQGNTLMQRAAKLAKQRFDAGDLNKVEVDLANLTYAQARFQRADAISQYVRATQNLVALTGSVNNNWPSLLSVFPDPEAQPQEIEKTVQQLPQMRAILSRVRAAQANIKVQAGQGTVNPTLALRAGQEEQAPLLGLNLSIPLQVRNNFQAEVDAANAEMIQAERESLDAYRKLKSRLQIAIVSYQLSRQAWLAWQESGADTLSEQIKLLERLWKEGELNTTDYLIQLNQALVTKASAIEQRGRMWTEWSEWLISSGKIEHWLYNETATNTR